METLSIQQRKLNIARVYCAALLKLVLLRPFRKDESLAIASCPQTKEI